MPSVPKLESVLEASITILRHLLSILLLPATVTLAVPYAILSSRSLRPLSLAAVILGAAVMGCGLMLVIVTIRQFVTLGRGTLAPWDPPRHLVVAGVYRHVRNPMISGVVDPVRRGPGVFFARIAR